MRHQIIQQDSLQPLNITLCSTIAGTLLVLSLSGVVVLTYCSAMAAMEMQDMRMLLSSKRKDSAPSVLHAMCNVAELKRQSDVLTEVAAHNIMMKSFILE